MLSEQGRIYLKHKASFFSLHDIIDFSIFRIDQ